MKKNNKSLIDKFFIKFLLFFGLIILFHLQTEAQIYKTLQKSGKRPSWVNGTYNNYIIVSGIGNTVEDAKNECVRNIKDIIINAIAVNVRSKTEINITQINGNSDEKMKFSVVSQSANIPYLNGISLAKSTDYYWEKVMVKKTKTEQYGYHVKYPFSDGELRTLIDDFQMQEEKTNERLAYLFAAKDTATYLESYANIISELKLIQNTVIDDRAEKIENELAEIKNSINAINFVPVTNTVGIYTFKLKINQKSIKTFTVPQLWTNCGNISQINFEDTLCLITYTADLCRFIDKPKGNLSFDLGQFKIDHNFEIDLNGNKVVLKIEDFVLIKKIDGDDNSITQSTFEIPLFSRFSNPFVINRIELKFENQTPIIIEKCYFPNKTSGIKLLKFYYKKPFNKHAFCSATKIFPFVAISFTYTNINTKKEEKSTLTNIKYTTDW